MPTITNYDQFGGRHWETGSVHNYLASRGFVAPHTGEPYSEALLMGVSGGLAMGYFNFSYEGYDPQCNILTRNTFDPFETMLSRLGVVQYLEQTRQAAKGESNLVEALEEGTPAIVWADVWGLPYNALPHDEGMWGAFPILVYGFDRDSDAVHIADRASVPLTVTVEQLAAARGRIKKDKYRLLTLDPPNPGKLASAVHLGLCDTVKLFTEKPPKGSKNNFGYNAYQYWAKMLTYPKQRNSWQKTFPPGLPMYAGLASAYEFAFLFGKGLSQDAERGLYAQFLEEAAVILKRPALQEAAEAFRASAAAWGQLPGLLLPDEIEPFVETRQLMLRKHQLFLEQGGQALDEIIGTRDRLAQIHDQMDSDFPLNAEQVDQLRERLAEQILAIGETELAAVEQLQAVVN